jgi:hypothetical protein
VSKFELEHALYASLSSKCGSSVQSGRLTFIQSWYPTGDFEAVIHPVDFSEVDDQMPPE